jgi:hypothetical protein
MVTTHIVVICLKIHTRLQSRDFRRCESLPSPHERRNHNSSNDRGRSRSTRRHGNEELLQVLVMVLVMATGAGKFLAVHMQERHSALGTPSGKLNLAKNVSSFNACAAQSFASAPSVNLLSRCAAAAPDPGSIKRWPTAFRALIWKRREVSR